MRICSEKDNTGQKRCEMQFFFHRKVTKKNSISRVLNRQFYVPMKTATPDG